MEISRDEEYYVSLYFNKINQNLKMLAQSLGEVDTASKAIVYLEYSKADRFSQVIEDANKELIRVFTNLGHLIEIEHHKTDEQYKIYKAEVWI